MAYKLGKVGTDHIISCFTEEVVEKAGWVVLTSDKPTDGKDYIVTPSGSWEVGTYVPTFPNTAVVDGIDIDTAYCETSLIAGRGWTASVSGFPFDVGEDELLYLINANGTDNGGTSRLHILFAPTTNKMAYRFANDGEVINKFNLVLDIDTFIKEYNIGNDGFNVIKKDGNYVVGFANSKGVIKYDPDNNTIDFSGFDKVTVDGGAIGGYTEQEVDAIVADLKDTIVSLKDYIDKVKPSVMLLYPNGSVSYPPTIQKGEEVKMLNPNRKEFNCLVTVELSTNNGTTWGVLTTGSNGYGCTANIVGDYIVIRAGTNGVIGASGTCINGFNITGSAYKANYRLRITKLIGEAEWSIS